MTSCGIYSPGFYYILTSGLNYFLRKKYQLQSSTARGCSAMAVASGSTGNMGICIARCDRLRPKSAFARRANRGIHLTKLRLCDFSILTDELKQIGPALNSTMSTNTAPVPVCSGHRSQSGTNNTHEFEVPVAVRHPDRTLQHRFPFDCSIP